MELLKKESTFLVHDRVYRSLRDRILHGYFKPGESLTLRGLASEFNTSVMPIRDTIRRLSSEGALKLSPHGRISIPVLTLERFKELVNIRRILESDLAIKALPRAHKALIDRLEVINLNMERFAISHDANSCIKANMEFHRTLYLRAQSPIMLSMLEAVWLQLSPTIRAGLVDNWNLVEKGEHNYILGALNKNDPDDLEFLITKDILSSQDLFVVF